MPLTDAERAAEKERIASYDSDYRKTISYRQDGGTAPTPSGSGAYTGEYGKGQTPFEQIESGTGAVGRAHSAVSSQGRFQDMGEVRRVATGEQPKSYVEMRIQSNPLAKPPESGAYDAAYSAAAYVNKQHEGFEVVRVQPAEDGGYVVGYNPNVSAGASMREALRAQLSVPGVTVIPYGDRFIVREASKTPAVPSAGSGVKASDSPAPPPATGGASGGFDFATNSIYTENAGMVRYDAPASGVASGSNPLNEAEGRKLAESGNAYYDFGTQSWQPGRLESQERHAKAVAVRERMGAYFDSQIDKSSSGGGGFRSRPPGLLSSQDVAMVALAPLSELAKGGVPGTPQSNEAATAAAGSFAREFTYIGTEYQRGNAAFNKAGMEQGWLQASHMGISGTVLGDVAYGAAQLSYAGYDAFARVSLIGGGAKLAATGVGAFQSAGAAGLKEFLIHDVYAGAVEVAGTPVRFATGLMPARTGIPGSALANAATAAYGNLAIGSVVARAAGDEGVVGSFGQGHIDVAEKVGRYVTFQSRPGETEELVVASTVWNAPYYGAKLIQAGMPTGSVQSGVVEGAYKVANVGTAAWIFGSNIVDAASEKGNLSPETIALGAGRASAELSIVENIFESKTSDAVFEASGLYKSAQGAVAGGIARGSVDPARYSGLWSSVEIEPPGSMRIGQSPDAKINVKGKGTFEVRGEIPASGTPSVPASTDVYMNLRPTMKVDTRTGMDITLKPDAKIEPKTDYEFKIEPTQGSRFDMGRVNLRDEGGGRPEPRMPEFPTDFGRTTFRTDFPTDLRPTSGRSDIPADDKDDIPADAKKELPADNRQDVKYDVKYDVKVDVVNPGILAGLLLPALGGGGGGSGSSAMGKRTQTPAQISDILSIELGTKAPAVVRPKRNSVKQKRWL